MFVPLHYIIFCFLFTDTYVLAQPILSNDYDEQPNHQHEQPNHDSIWTNCGGANDIVQVTQLKLVPYPPKKGQPLDILVNITLQEDISEDTSSGIYTVSIAIDYCVFNSYVNINHRTLFPIDLSAFPLNEEQLLKIKAQFSGFIPSGTYRTQVVATGPPPDHLQAFCVEINYEI